MIYLFLTLTVVVTLLSVAEFFYISTLIKDLIKIEKKNTQLSEFNQSSWFPLKQGDIQCVFTNYTIYNQTEKSKPVAIWGHRLPNLSNNSDSWCSPPDLMRYYDLLEFDCNCSDEKIRELLQKNYPLHVMFNCSVNHECTLLSEFFQAPPNRLVDTVLPIIKIMLLSLLILLTLIFSIYFGVKTKLEYTHRKITKLYAKIEGK